MMRIFKKKEKKLMAKAVFLLNSHPPEGRGKMPIQPKLMN